MLQMWSTLLLRWRNKQRLWLRLTCQTLTWPCSLVRSLVPTCRWLLLWLMDHHPLTLKPPTYPPPWLQEVTVTIRRLKAWIRLAAVLHLLLPAAEGYRWMITPEMIQHRAGLWYVDTRLSNSSLQPDVTLKITSFMTKCLYWNVYTETWRTDGCMVSFHLCAALGVRETWCVAFSSGGKQKHLEAHTLSVQPPHSVRELLLCDAELRGHKPNRTTVCHRVSELRGAGAAVLVLRPLPGHSDVGVLCRPQGSPKGQPLHPAGGLVCVYPECYTLRH